VEQAPKQDYLTLSERWKPSKTQFPRNAEGIMLAATIAAKVIMHDHWLQRRDGVIGVQLDTSHG
jgi:hypothetical protein